MSSFMLFNIYLILNLTSVCVSIRGMIQRNNNRIAAMVVLFFMSFIGLSCNFPGWVREFCGMYGIVLLG